MKERRDSAVAVRWTRGRVLMIPRGGIWRTKEPRRERAKCRSGAREARTCLVGDRGMVSEEWGGVSGGLRVEKEGVR